MARMTDDELQAKIRSCCSAGVFVDVSWRKAAKASEAIMVSDPDVAKQISELMIEIERRVAKSLTIVNERCSPEEYKAYKKATGKVVSSIVFDIIEPLYEKHPELKPPDWEK